MNENPIGIFDSGVGGITIYDEIHKLLPYENIIYLADSKNAPYGGKTKQEIIALSDKNTKFLLKNKCKIIVVACNTASTNAVKTLREKYDVPIIRVQPAIKPAALNSKTKTVGILATQGTLESELLWETSQKFAQGVKVIGQVGEGLVSLIEKGQINSLMVTKLLKKYLQPMLKQNIDYLVLGCTHYPLLIPQLKKIVGNKVTILDSGEAIARQTKVVLEQEHLLKKTKNISSKLFFTNSNTEVFQKFMDTFHKGFKAEKIDF